MGEHKTSLKTLAVFYICLYAIFYPLAAHLLMPQEGTNGVGSSSVQVFQALVLVALFFVGQFGRQSFHRLLDVWIVGVVYFTSATLCFAVSYDSTSRMIELAYGGRFILWFLFASIISRGSFEPRRLAALATSFWLGCLIQGSLAATAIITRSGGSIYREVFATTGGAYVSGKMVVAFVTLGAFMSIYWFVRDSRRRIVYFCALALATLVILFSYNRSAQLSLALVCIWSLYWLFRTGRIKTATFLVAVLVSSGALLVALFDETFMVRWMNIHEDGGSGRDKLIGAALHNAMNPHSLASLLFGQGYEHTKTLMYEACGSRIGAHSDLFDFLTTYGLVGLGFYFWCVVRLLDLKRGIEFHSWEYLCVRVSTFFVIFMGLFTGLFQSSYVFIMLFTFVYYWRTARESFVFGTVQSREQLGYQRPYLSERDPDELGRYLYSNAEDDAYAEEYEDERFDVDDEEDRVDENEMKTTEREPIDLTSLTQTSVSEHIGSSDSSSNASGSEQIANSKSPVSARDELNDSALFLEVWNNDSDAIDVLESMALDEDGGELES